MRPGYIDVTEVPLEQLVRAAYDPSRQQGLGVFDPSGRDEISDEVVNEIIERGRTDPMCAIGMDYVNGRSVKFHVNRFGDRLGIYHRWYDHSDDQLRALLERVGLEGKLVDEARASQKAREDEVAATAREFLQQRGGVAKQDRKLKRVPEPVEDFPEDVDEGLSVLRQRDRAVTDEYTPEGYTIWRLVEPQ